MVFQWYYNEAVKSSSYWIVSGIILVILFVILKLLRKHPVSTSLLAMYLILLLGFTVFSRSRWEVANIIQLHQFSFRELWRNVMIFVPLVFLVTNHLHYVREKWTKARYILVICAVISVLIEVIQLVSKRGYFDIEDIVGNFVGGILGLGIYRLFVYVKSGINSVLI